MTMIETDYAKVRNGIEAELRAEMIGQMSDAFGSLFQSLDLLRADDPDAVVRKIQAAALETIRNRIRAMGAAI